jgi:hypothetical protein
MAYGFRCKHCGWQETDHNGTAEEDPSEWSKVYPGRSKSLATCPGYKSEDPAGERLARLSDTEEANGVRDINNLE